MIKSYRQFDNVAEALLSLFAVGCLDSWTTVMYVAIDSNGIDMEPVRNASIFWVYLFIGFIIIGNFFCVNFILSSICDACSNKYKGMSIKDKLIKNWEKCKRSLYSLEVAKVPIRPVGLLRASCFDLTHNIYFEYFMIFMAFLQCIVLASNTFGEATSVTNGLNDCNLFLSVVFISDAVLKISAVGFMSYIADNFNKFDLMVVAGVVIGFLYNLITKTNGQVYINIFRCMRLLKMIKLLKVQKSLIKIINIVFTMMPGL